MSKIHKSSSRKPAITVLMPVYNAEKFLDSAIDSILCQSFTDFEFLIIDDGSTDTSAQIITSYAAKDKRIRVVTHSKNKGLVISLNEGLQIAGGMYIARMDADDISLPNRLKIQYDFLQKNPAIAAVGGCIEYIDQNSHSLGIGIFGNNCNYLKWRTLFSCPIPHPTAFYRTEVIRQIGGYNASAVHYEDHELWSRITKQHKISNIPEVIVKYRQHSEAISIKHKRIQKEHVSTLIHQNINAYISISKTDVETLKQQLQPNIHIVSLLHKKYFIMKQIMRAFIAKENLTQDEINLISKDLQTQTLSHYLLSVLTGLRHKLFFM